MTSLKKFQHDLGRELVGAAHRQASAPDPKWSFTAIKVLPVVGLAAVLVLLALSVVDLPGPFGSSPAVADTFVITQLDDSVILDVVDIITDPDEVTEQLTEELGLQAEVLAIPSDPQLVGKISAMFSSGNVSPELVFDDNNGVTQVVLPAGFQESIIIEYGRAAAPGEPYIATTTSPLCSTYFGRTFETIRAEVDGLASLVRYQTTNERGIMRAEVDIEDVPDTHMLIDISALSDDSFIVTYGANTTSRQIHPNCQ